MTFLSDRVRKHEHLALGFVVGLALCAFARCTTSDGDECLTTVKSYRGEVLPGTGRRQIVEVAYPIRFEGRLRHYNGHATCDVDLHDTQCTTFGRQIECRPISHQGEQARWTSNQ